MSINPFDILKNAQKIQEQMASFQEKLGDIIVTGSSGGGMAQIDMTGKMEVLEIRLSKEVVDPSEISLLQDLIKAAFIDAMEKSKEEVKTQLGNMTGGWNLPPGFSGLV